MPHVVVDAEPELRELLEAFEPTVDQVDGRVVKTQEAFLDADETSLVVTGLAIDQGDKRDALIRVDRREGDAVVRIEDQFRPEVNDVVKRLVAHVAAFVLDQTGGEVVRTNVQAQLDRVSG